MKDEDLEDFVSEDLTSSPESLPDEYFPEDTLLDLSSMTTPPLSLSDHFTDLLNHTESEEIKRIEPEQVKGYLISLNQRLEQLSKILMREKDHFVVPYLTVVRHTIDCLIAKHAFDGQDQIDFPLTIDPTHSGFPTVKDLYLLQKNKKEAPSALQQLSSRQEIIDTIRDAILKDRSPRHDQILLKRQRFFSKLLEGNLLEDYTLREPQLTGEAKNGRRQYTLEWACLERHTHVPVFYCLWLEQDAGAVPLHEKQNDVVKTILYSSQYSLSDLRMLVSEIDTAIDALHPKLIYKYTIGPFYHPLTTNSPELTHLLNGEDDKALLKFTLERVASVNVIDKPRNIFKRLLYGNLEKEVFGPLDDSDRRMIAPFRIKQKLVDKDEKGNPCVVYGVTEGGDIVG